MRRIFALIALPLVSIVFGAEPPKGPLSAKDLSDGWLMLFDGESTFGWTTTGDVTVKDGQLTTGEKSSFTYKVALPPGTSRVNTGLGLTEQNEDGGEFSRAKAGAVRELHFKPSGLKSIFNGKDLTGWKVFHDEKRGKSKFEVTNSGELHLTNGPGDLQTVGKYSDFVLQLEFKTNGDSLNSGIFFRCVPDQYQNGYEFQIHNGIKDHDRSKPLDGGTGGIYRRQAARKVVSNDNEWAHLTLIARGPTFATWVNGYPVTLWTDERAKDDNPRKGLRLEAGHLSIQGHDPTTDLLFRNIQVAEIKK
jgi:hypothetical protein